MIAPLHTYVAYATHPMISSVKQSKTNAAPCLHRTWAVWQNIIEVISVRVLSLRSSVIHGFVTEPWYSHHVRVFMWARGFEYARVAHSLICVPCFMLERGVWFPALMSWVSVTWRGSDTRAPFSVIVWVRGLEFARHCALLSMGVLLCCTQFVFLSAACIYVYLVLCGTCVHVLFCTWLAICLLAMCLCFCFVWACGFCPSFLCATCSCQFVLTPPILLPVYWFIFPSCFPSLPSSFSPFIISLCLQFRVGSLPNVWCRLCPIQPCPALSSSALPSSALPACQPVLFFPYGVVFVRLFVCFLLIKAYFPPAIGSSLSSFPSTLTIIISDAVYTGCCAVRQIPDIKLLPCSVYVVLTQI